MTTEPGQLADSAMAGPWAWSWFDDSPRGETYGVRQESEVLCYTNRTKRGYEDALLIAAAVNAYYTPC